MYIINNIDRPLGIHTYGVQKKYQSSNYNLSTVTLKGDTYYDAAGNRVGNTKGLFDDVARYLKNKYGQAQVNEANKAMGKKWNYANGQWLSDAVKKQVAYNTRRRQEEQSKPLIFKPQDVATTPWFSSKQSNQNSSQVQNSTSQTFNTARPHKYDKSVEYRWYNGTWQVRYTKGKDTNWYNVAEGSTGYDRFGNYNRFKNGKWVKIKEDQSTGDSTPQKPRLDPNRFVSMYDTTGLWKQHVQDNNLTDRDSVRRFQKEVLGFDDTQADGIWGRNTEAAYSRWKANKDAATLQLNSPVKQITISNTPISRWDTNENLKGKFNNYASMQNYVNSNPEDSFSKAMTTRFGNTDTWNQQDVENALDVAGTYRGSDRRDIANSFNNYYQQQQKTDNNIKNIINNTNQTMNNWRNFTSNLGIFKNGGLISRNPITRFKQGGMLRKLQNGYKIVGTDDQGYPIYQAVDSNVQAQIEAQAAKEVQDFLNSLRASKQQQEQEFSPVDAINTWKDIITIPKKEVITKSQKRSSKNNSNKKNQLGKTIVYRGNRYTVYPSALNSSNLSVEIPNIEVLGTDKRPKVLTDDEQQIVRSSKNNFNKKNKGSQSQKKFPVDPMPPISEYEAPQWGGIRTPIVPQ